MMTKIAEETNQTRYTLTTSEYINEANERVILYGVEIVEKLNGQVSTAQYEAISDRREEVEALLALFEEENLSPIHLHAYMDDYFTPTY